jgi:hypothetical protein
VQAEIEKLHVCGIAIFVQLRKLGCPGIAPVPRFWWSKLKGIRKEMPISPVSLLGLHLPTPLWITTAGAALALGIGVAQPSQAAVSFTFTTNTQQTTSTRVFSAGGINLTVDNAQGANILTASSTTGGTGGINTDINNGLCVSLYAGFSKGQCQYLSATAGDPTLTGMTFTFSRPVRLLGFDILKPGGVESGSLSFSASGSQQTFTFNNAGGADTPNGVVFRSMAFSSPGFVVAANTPVTVSSIDTVFTPNSAGSFRINNFDVQPVPGPVPVLGLAAALGWSRRIRNKLKAASNDTDINSDRG